MQMFHGSGKALTPGEKLHDPYNIHNYVAKTERWADAFAYRDAASKAVRDAVDAMLAHSTAQDLKLSMLRPEASQVHGFVHTVQVDGALEQDPDFPDCADSARTTAPVTVISSTAGQVGSWRQFREIVAPYQLWSEGTAAYDDEGYVQPPPAWTAWGYTAADMRLLGPWYPFEAIWETEQQSLTLISEFALPFLSIPKSRLRDDVLERIHAEVPFTASTAETARTMWWQ